MAQTLMARLPWLTRTHSWVPMIPYMRLLSSNFCIYVFLLLFSFSIFSDRRSLKIENENNNTKTLATKVPSIVPRIHFINIETYPVWLVQLLTGTTFHGPKLLKFYSSNNMKYLATLIR